MQAARAATRTDEVALYAATAVAVAATMLAAGAGSGSVRVGSLGVALSLVGVGVSWQMRGWRLPAAIALGLPLGAGAAASLQGFINWEMEAEVSTLYMVRGEISLGLALRLAVFALALSFVLVRPQVPAFLLVPAITAFGLVGSRGHAMVVGGCFLVFFLAALACLAQAMLLSGMPAEWRSTRTRQQLRMWRRHHWAMLACLAAAAFLLAYLLYLPMVSYVTQYRFYVPFVAGVGGLRRFSGRTRPRDAPATYAVGRGPIMLAETPVLSFQGDSAEYWRGEVFNTYTGAAWLQGEYDLHSIPAAGHVLDLAPRFPAKPGVRLKTNTVRAEVDLPLVLYAPGQLQQVTFSGRLARRLPDRLQVDSAGCVSAPQAVIPAGARYQVVSAPLDIQPAAARVSLSQAPIPVSELDETYLRIPLGERQVADLARRVTADADTPLDKLGSLVSFLQQNYAYTLDAPAIPQGEHAAQYFLLRQKRGYCDLFATALAVMARSVGIPTRLATGYAGGHYDPERDRYILRESDAHAWVEAYVPPWGWISADATPATELPPLSPVRRGLLLARFFYQDHPTEVNIWAVLLGAALLYLMNRAWRARRGPAVLRSAEAGPRAIVFSAYARLCHLLARRGRPRVPSQTPLEFLVALESPAPPAAPPLAETLPPRSLPPIRALTEIFVRARYGPGAVGDDLARQAVQHVGEVQQALRRKSSKPETVPSSADTR